MTKEEKIKQEAMGIAFRILKDRDYIGKCIRPLHKYVPPGTEEWEVAEAVVGMLEELYTSELNRKMEEALAIMEKKSFPIANSFLETITDGPRSQVVYLSDLKSFLNDTNEDEKVK